MRLNTGSYLLLLWQQQQENAFAVFMGLLKIYKHTYSHTHEDSKVQM